MGIRVRRLGARMRGALHVLVRARPATCPTGRILTDDVFCARFAWLTRGRVTPGGLGPHKGPPGRVPVPRPAQSVTRALLRPARSGQQGAEDQVEEGVDGGP